MLEQWIKENANMKDGGSVAVINDDVWILPPRCFSNMPGLKKVILPYNLRKIGAFSFAGCRSLEVIDIPRQVVLIDDGALDRYVYEINESFYETPEYAQFLRRNRLHTSWPVQEGADIDLYYEDPYARANVELFFYSHYTVPLDALDVRSARKAAKRFAAGC